MGVFCPQAADWGNVADWFSGIGSMLAVCVALFVALRDHSHRRREKVEAAFREAQIENSFLAEALRLYRDIRYATQTVLDGYATNEVSFDDWKSTASSVREVALRYQQMPKITFRAYKEMDNIINITRHAEAVDQDMYDTEMVMKSVLYNCDHSSQAIMHEPNPLAPLNW